MARSVPSEKDDEVTGETDVDDVAVIGEVRYPTGSLLASPNADDMINLARDKLFHVSIKPIIKESTSTSTNSFDKICYKTLCSIRRSR